MGDGAVARRGVAVGGSLSLDEMYSRPCRIGKALCRAYGFNLGKITAFTNVKRYAKAVT